MKRRCFVDVLLKVVAMLYRLFSLFVVIHFVQLWSAALAEPHNEVTQSLSDAIADQSHYIVTLSGEGILVSAGNDWIVP